MRVSFGEAEYVVPKKTVSEDWMKEMASSASRSSLDMVGCL